MSHKIADELKRDDRFVMAGNLFKVITTQDVSVDWMIKVTFIPITTNPFDAARCTMTIPREMLFHLN